MMTILADHWLPVKDGDARAFALFRRHYSYREYADGRRANLCNRNRQLFVGPGGKLVLMTVDCDALFVWRKFIDKGQAEWLKNNVDAVAKSDPSNALAGTKPDQTDDSPGASNVNRGMTRNTTLKIPRQSSSAPQPITPATPILSTRGAERRKPENLKTRNEESGTYAIPLLTGNIVEDGQQNTRSMSEHTAQFGAIGTESDYATIGKDGDCERRSDALLNRNGFICSKNQAINASNAAQQLGLPWITSYRSPREGHTQLKMPKSFAEAAMPENITDDLYSGVCAAVFRNESPVLSSALILEAEQHAWARWPGERLYTYVDPGAVRSTNPGTCYLKAGWRKCGATGRGLLILEKLP